MSEQIKNLHSKLKAAIKSRSKTVTMTTDEANLLLIEISSILLNKLDNPVSNNSDNFQEIDSDTF